MSNLVYVISDDDGYGGSEPVIVFTNKEIAEKYADKGYYIQEVELDPEAWVSNDI